MSNHYIKGVYFFSVDQSPIFYASIEVHCQEPCVVTIEHISKFKGALSHFRILLSILLIS